MKRKFLKDHLIWILGGSLPLCVAFLFYFASSLPKVLVQPPLYDVLYMVSSYPHKGADFQITNQKLIVSINSEVKKRTLPMPKLYRYSAKTATSTEIPITIPFFEKKDSANEREVLSIPQIQNWTIDPNETAPDGYHSVTPQRRNYDLSILLGRSIERQLFITKKGRGYVIKHEGYSPIRFLGWIVNEGENKKP
jgi:hypothetical protein